MSQVNLLDTLSQRIIAQNQDLNDLDFAMVKNQLLAILGIDTLEQTISDNLSTLQIIDEVAIDNVHKSYLLDLLTPKTSTINHTFWQLYQESPQKATDYYYQLVRQNDYIQVAQIKKNIRYTVDSKFGQLEITINLSKPEKTVKSIAAKAQAPKQLDRSYPKCQLCFENEGFTGDNDYPIRGNHRMIHLTLQGQPWGMQYSPYEYFDEHIIVIDKEHRPMKINGDTIEQLLEFVDQFPHYFLGSNAGLPIIGGSMLAHEHYQGGKHTFPVEKATDAFSFENRYSEVKSTFLNWPVSTIRLRSTNRAQIMHMAKDIITAWETFSDPEIDINAYTKKTPHHSLNPISRKEHGEYVLYMMLRDNNVSAQYPDGIFHVHPQYQHIKQENIGLIEAMGMAILPGRLKNELTEVKHYILGQPNNIRDIHRAWADQIKPKFDAKTSIDRFVDQEVGHVFADLLVNVGVFKNINEANPHIQKFLKTI